MIDDSELSRSFCNPSYSLGSVLSPYEPTATATAKGASGDVEGDGDVEAEPRPQPPPVAVAADAGVVVGVANSPDSGVSSQPASCYSLALASASSTSASASASASASSSSADLPPGWQRHCDEGGSCYYWHLASGTIQRHPPRPHDRPSRPLSFHLSSDATTPTGLEQEQQQQQQQQQQQEECGDSQCAGDDDDSTDSVGDNNNNNNNNNNSSSQLQFPLTSLGWQLMEPEDVECAARSSKAVNACIRSLAAAAAAAADGVSEQPDVVLELGEQQLRLLSASGSGEATELLRLPVLAAKLWGVGRDNRRDFAFVARDSNFEYVCRAFRCRRPGQARRLANALCLRCERLVASRQRRRLQQQQQQHRSSDSSSSSSSNSSSNININSNINSINSAAVPRPADLPGLLFPAPQEEPSKAIPCLYVGCKPVPRPAGVQLLNDAIDEVVSGSSGPLPVTVNVAPSTISIRSDLTDEAVVEFRVRFLSFMGVSRRSVKLAAFIFHTAAGGFECHVCHCEPTSGPLCKTVEAACNLRYQKCLDAHPSRQLQQRQQQQQQQQQTPSAKGADIVHSVVSLFHDLWRRNSKV